MVQFKGIPILSAGEALSGEASAGARLSGEASASAVLSREASAGVVLSGEASAGVVLSREASAGAVLSREASAGAVLSREASAGQALSGGALSGEGVSGKASRSGEPARSGEKYRTPQGFTAIKDGIKANVKPASAGKPEIGARNPAARKPTWLRAPLASGVGFQAVKHIVREHRLSTVCEEAKCPNIGECWNAGTATIMLMGAVCTRACRFCAVDTGNPQGWLDPEEPENVARSVELMGLQYVVLTSVDRDDLPDGGAAHYAAAIRAIKARTPQTAVEALTPDFAGVLADVYTVMDSGLDVFAQNVETVERLTHPVRDPRAGYRRTLDVLDAAKAYRPSVLTKTSLMLGLGETDAEIRGTMKDLRAAAVDLLTLGQYLRPTSNHLEVERFVSPEEFAEYRAWALDLGFLECVSGPLVRSSYRAEQALARNNAGLDQGLARRAVRAADSA